MAAKDEHRFSPQITGITARELVTTVEASVEGGATRVVLDLSATPGGDVESGLWAYDELRSMQLELVTYNTGEIASMGNVLFLAGVTRLASPQATFFMHPIRIEATAAFETTARWLDLNDLRKLRAKAERSAGRANVLGELDRGIIRLTREERDVRTVVEQRTKLTGPEITALILHEKTVDAREAEAMGIIHEIVSPSPE